MPVDPWFYAAAIPAVVLIGLSKGGLSGVGLLSMPLLSLVIPPIEAAAVMLPVLLVQDAVTVYAFRRDWDATTLRMTLPGAMAGIGLGMLTAAAVSPDAVRLGVGSLAIAFCVHAWLGGRTGAAGDQPHAVAPGSVYGLLAGYTSFLIHAGGPPYNMYALPRNETRSMFVATSAMFFATVNVIKVPAYASLGQFDAHSLWLSATLVPAAVLGNLAGIHLVRSMPVALFYQAIYALTLAVGLKLVWDGARVITGY
jgi:uncharacterized membrane protein YfcA